MFVLQPHNKEKKIFRIIDTLFVIWVINLNIELNMIEYWN